MFQAYTHLYIFPEPWYVLFHKVSACASFHFFNTKCQVTFAPFCPFVCKVRNVSPLTGHTPLNLPINFTDFFLTNHFNPLTLKINAARSSDKSVSIYDPKRYQNPEVYQTSNTHHEYLKPIFLDMRSRSVSSPFLSYLKEHTVFPTISSSFRCTWL